jgi:uncharacterized protein YcfJ
MIAGLAAAMAAPSLADAESCQSHAHDRKVTGTVVGGVGGALIGNAITHNTTGAVLGGVSGALVGNQIAREKCGERRADYRRDGDDHREYYRRHHEHD